MNVIERRKTDITTFLNNLLKKQKFSFQFLGIGWNLTYQAILKLQKAYFRKEAQTNNN